MKGMEIIESALDTLYFFYFLANGSTNPDVFQLQGKSSLKISARWGSPFRRSQGTNIQTDRLTDRQALLQSDTLYPKCIYVKISLEVWQDVIKDVIVTVGDREITFTCRLCNKIILVTFSVTWLKAKRI